jgi:ABC-type amino acid transport substrate-binding protein
MTADGSIEWKSSSMHWLIELLGEIGPVPKGEDIYKFSYEHFWIAVFVAFGLLCLIAAVLYSSVIESFRAIYPMQLKSPLAIAFTIAIMSITGLAILCVSFVRNSLEPVPAFTAGQREFVREPVVLTWNQAALPKDEDVTEPVIYQLQSARNSEFTEAVKRSKTDANTFYNFEEGVRWWRVRPEIREAPLTGWSKAIRTTFYRNAFNRIKGTGRLRVFVSTSINQGIFKYLGEKGELSGADILIIGRIAEALSQELQVPISKPSPVPIDWEELLSQPAKGTADLVISSISKSDQRENQYNLKFSKSYFCTTQSIMFRKDNRPSASIVKFLHNKNVGYQENTTSEKLIAAILADKGEQYFTKKSFREAAALVEALQNPNSSVQVVLTDTPFALDASLPASNAEELESRELTDADYPPTVPPVERLERYAIGVSQGETQLLTVVNGLIANMKSHGQLEKLLEVAAEGKFPNMDPERRSRLYVSKECVD